MPVYEYQCNACHHQFEEWQKISDRPIQTCPKCHKKRVERLISQTSFQLKGSGWYSDLYSSKKATASGSGDKGGDKGGGDKGGGGETAPKAKEVPAPAPAPSKKKDGGSKAATASA